MDRSTSVRLGSRVATVIQFRPSPIEFKRALGQHYAVGATSPGCPETLANLSEVSGEQLTTGRA